MTNPVAWRWGEKRLSGRVHWTYTSVKTRKTSVPMFDQAAIDAAVAEERERCAKACEQIEDDAYALWRATADPTEQGRSIGAGHCAQLIRLNT